MNPFLHPAVATPLDPDDILIWTDDASAIPQPRDPAAKPAVPPAAPAATLPEARQPGMTSAGAARIGNAGPGPSGPMFESVSRRSVSRACARVAPSPARRLSSVWRGRARSLALVTAVGLGAGGLALAQSLQVDVNAATSTELEAIKGIGPKTARTIVSERQRSGPFESFQDFSERIRGIGPKRAASLRAAGLVIGTPATARFLATPSEPGTGGAPVGVLVR